MVTCFTTQLHSRSFQTTAAQSITQHHNVSTPSSATCTLHPETTLAMITPNGIAQLAQLNHLRLQIFDNKVSRSDELIRSCDCS